MDADEDNFKTSFKYYKSRNPPPDLSNVIDFGAPDVGTITPVAPEPQDGLPPIIGLKPVSDWKIYQLNSQPGFYFIRNPFTASAQQYWVYRCARDFPDKPNICNLDAHMNREDSENIWENSHRQRSKGRVSEKTSMDRLRWVTLGYHHNWDTKVYDEKNYTPFPPDLGYLSRFVISCLPLDRDYRAEAAIVNYYHLDSTLAGHTDHSEFDLSAPLLSVSFGQSAIFLVGGVTKKTIPVPIFLRSGDIVVMSGDCRLAYHAIPRIIREAESSRLPWLQGATQPCSTSTGKDPSKCSEKLNIENDNKPDALEHCSEPSKKVQRTLNMDMVSKSGETSTDDQRWKSVDGNISAMPGDLSDDLTDCVQKINEHIECRLRSLDFEPFAEYLKTSRINMNVRQVFEHGQNIENVNCRKREAQSDICQTT